MDSGEMAIGRAELYLRAMIDFRLYGRICYGIL